MLLFTCSLLKLILADPSFINSADQGTEMLFLPCELNASFDHQFFLLEHPSRLRQVKTFLVMLPAQPCIHFQEKSYKQLMPLMTKIASDLFLEGIFRSSFHTWTVLVNAKETCSGYVDSSQLATHQISNSHGKFIEKLSRMQLEVYLIETQSRFRLSHWYLG